MTATTRTIVIPFKRGSTSQNDIYTGLPGEITIDSTKRSIRVHDGIKAGGEPLLRLADLEDVTTQVTTATAAATSASTSASNAAASATAAATSESNAATSASDAAASASDANASATAAATSESNAASSATAAATSESNAAASATAAATSASDAAASAAAASSKEPIIAAGTIGQYWRGDKTWVNFPTNVSTFTNDAGYITTAAVPTEVSAFANDAGYITAAGVPVQSVAGKTGDITLVKADVGLANVDNTSDANKPVSSAQQTALNTKEPTIAAGTALQYWAGDKTWKTFPTNVSAFANDSGYLVASDIPVNSVAGRGGDVVLTKADVGLENVLNVEQIPASEKGVAGGVATLDGGGMVPSTQLPSYVDDVLEYPDLASFPTTGQTGKIYIAINGQSASDPSRQYRWSGTLYIENYASPGTADNVAEGTNNLYFTTARVRATALTGLDLSVNAAISSADSMLVAFGKLQKQTTDLATTVSTKANSANAALTGTTTVETLTASQDASFNSTGAIQLPSGTTAQRPSSNPGKIRYNATLDQYEGAKSGGAWGELGGGATGAAGNKVFMENDQNITGDYTITTGKNALTAGPITIDDDVLVTIPTGSVWSIVQGA